jgi:hypothetical protein
MQDAKGLAFDCQPDMLWLSFSRACHDQSNTGSPAEAIVGF